MPCIRLVIIFALSGLLSTPHTGWASQIPAARFYCSTASPLGATYTDLKAGIHLRLPVPFVIDIDGMLAGPAGYLALTGEDKLAIYHDGRHILTVKAPQARLIGWIHQRLVFRERDSQTRGLDVRTGKVVQTRLPPGLVDLGAVHGDTYQIEQRGTTVIGTSFGKGRAKKRSWAAARRNCGFCSTARIGNRYLVLELHQLTRAADGSWASDTIRAPQLWVIDFATGRQRRLAVRRFTLGFCVGRIPAEMLLGLPAAVSKDGHVAYSRVVAVDLRTLRQRTLLRKKGALDLVGLSDDGRWLLATQGRAEVGSGSLLAVHLSDGSERVLQKGVYDCAPSAA